MYQLFYFLKVYTKFNLISDPTKALSINPSDFFFLTAGHEVKVQRKERILRKRLKQSNAIDFILM